MKNSHFGEKNSTIRKIVIIIAHDIGHPIFVLFAFWFFFRNILSGRVVVKKKLKMSVQCLVVSLHFQFDALLDELPFHFLEHIGHWLIIGITEIGHAQ